MESRAYEQVLALKPTRTSPPNHPPRISLRLLRLECAGLPLPRKLRLTIEWELSRGLFTKVLAAMTCIVQSLKIISLTKVGE